MANIGNAFEKMPEFLTAEHLVELGLYRSCGGVYLARKNNCGPDYVRLMRRIVYPKSSVIEFVEKNLKGQNEPRVG